MADIAITYDNIAQAFGTSITSGDITTVEDLSTAIALSLFTWAPAKEGDVVSTTQTWGYWGDSYATTTGDIWGSRLWLLLNSKITPNTLLQAEEYCYEALNWLTADGVAASFDVLVERSGINDIAITVSVYKSKGGVETHKFDNVWGTIAA